MRQKTLQEQYNLIKEGKGNKDVFLKTVKASHPHLVRNAADFKEATTILKQRSVISENVWGIATSKSEKPDWFKVFDENTSVNEDVKAEEKETSKEVKDVQASGYDQSDKSDINNMNFEEFLRGYYTELKDPKNAKKTEQQLKDIVKKCLEKNPLYYVEKAQFGIKDIGYTKDTPGLKQTQIKTKGNYVGSGYGDATKKKIETGEIGTGYLKLKENKMIKLADLINEVDAREIQTEGKKLKKESIQDRIKEIEKRGSVAALEAKINAIQEEIGVREGKLTMVSENEALSEFVNPAKVNEIKREIKELEKAKTKYGKMFEKLSGKAHTTPIVTEEGEVNEILGFGSDIKKGGILWVSGIEGNTRFRKKDKGVYKVEGTNQASFYVGEIWKPGALKKLKVGQTIPLFGEILKLGDGKEEYKKLKI